MHDHDAGEVRLLVLASLGALLILAIELIGGLVTQSLSLIADAAHMATDVAAAMIALSTAWLAQRPRDRKRTYGYGRLKVLGAFVNGAGLFAVALFIALEAMRRFSLPSMVEPRGMLLIALLALCLNIALSFLLAHAAKRSLNVRAVLMHVMGDALASGGVIIAALIITLTGWRQADPLMSFLISGLVGYSAWMIVRSSTNVLMEGVPYDFDLEAMQRRLEEQSDIHGVHDVHVWSVSGGGIATSFHVLVSEAMLPLGPQVVVRLKELLHREFSVDHTTIEIECDDCESACEPAECVAKVF